MLVVVVVSDGATENWTELGEFLFDLSSSNLVIKVLNVKVSFGVELVEILLEGNSNLSSHQNGVVKLLLSLLGSIWGRVVHETESSWVSSVEVLLHRDIAELQN